MYTETGSFEEQKPYPEPNEVRLRAKLARGQRKQQQLTPHLANARWHSLRSCVGIYKEKKMIKYPRKAWLQRDGRVTAIVYSDQPVEMGDGIHGLPALVTDPNLNEGKPYLALIPVEEMWTFVEPELVPEGAPREGYLVYQEDEDQDVFVSLVFSEEEAHAHRRTAGYLGYVHIPLPTGSLEF